MQPEPWAQCECVGVGVVADAAESVEDLVDGRVGEYLGAFFFEEMTSRVSVVDEKIIIKMKTRKKSEPNPVQGGCSPLRKRMGLKRAWKTTMPRST